MLFSLTINNNVNALFDSRGTIPKIFICVTWMELLHRTDILIARDSACMRLIGTNESCKKVLVEFYAFLVKFVKWML